MRKIIFLLWITIMKYCYSRKADVSQQYALGNICRLFHRGMPPYCSVHTSKWATSSMHSEQWAAYKSVITIPGIGAHCTVNHRLEFVTASVTHTHNIESYWQRVKGKVRWIMGCHAHQLASYPDDITWHEHHGHQTCMASVNIMLLSYVTLPSKYPV